MYFDPSSLPLRSTATRGSEYTSALASHWADGTPEQYKKRWQQNVLDKASGIRFTQNYDNLTAYYVGYEDTNNGTQSGAPLRPADAAFTEPCDWSSPPWSSGGSTPKKHPIVPWHT